MKKSRIEIRHITITSVFIALTFVATGVGFNGPAGGRIHLGNFVAIMASLLFGPIIGAITGSLGMGLFNVYGGWTWDTTVRTFIINFFLGLIVGFVYKYLLKKKAKNKINASIYTLAFISALIGMTVNLMLEFIFRVWFTNIIVGGLSLWDGSAIGAAALRFFPESPLRGIVTVALIPVVFRYLYNALDHYDIIKENDNSTDKENIDN